MDGISLKIQSHDSYHSFLSKGFRSPIKARVTVSSNALEAINIPLLDVEANVSHRFFSIDSMKCGYLLTNKSSKIVIDRFSVSDILPQYVKFTLIILL